MDKEKDTHLPAAIPVETPEKPFGGYTLEDLKYQRAMMALRKEFAKSKLLQSLDAMRPNAKPKGHESNFGSKFALARTLGGKLFGSLNTLDYVMLGMSLFGTAKKAYSLFRRKK